MAEAQLGPLGRLWEYLLSFGAYPEENDLERGRRRIIVGGTWLSVLYVVFTAGILQLGVGLFPSAPLVILVAVALAVLHLGALMLLRRYPKRLTTILQPVFAAQMVALLAVAVMLGGLLEAGLIMVWGLLTVMGALIALGVGWAVFWFGVFLAALILSVVLPTWIEPLYSWPDPEFRGLVNISGAAVFIFLSILYFVRQRDRFQRESDDLLHNILPDEVAAQLKQNSGMIADHYDQVSVLFADVVDFTPMSASMTPSELVGLLNDIFTVFDDYVEEMDLEKIKTIGDAYMVAAGVPTRRADHAHVIADLAVRMRDYVADHEVAGHRISFRIGISSGPVVAGIIGHRKFIYDMWGDTVNTASRMESHGTPGDIQITAATRRLIEDDFVCERRGTIDVKGKGEVETWYLLGHRVGAVTG